MTIKLGLSNSYFTDYVSKVRYIKNRRSTYTDISAVKMYWQNYLWCTDFTSCFHSASQSGVWRCALQQNSEMPKPVGHGWIIEKDNLEPVWMTLLFRHKFNCTRSCKATDCQCAKHGLKCTELCKLITVIIEKVNPLLRSLQTMVPRMIVKMN